MQAGVPQRIAMHYQDGDSSDKEAQVVRGKGPVPSLPLHHELLPGVLGGQGPKGQQTCPKPQLPNEGSKLLQLGLQHCCFPAPSITLFAYITNQEAHGSDQHAGATEGLAGLM